MKNQRRLENLCINFTWLDRHSLPLVIHKYAFQPSEAGQDLKHSSVEEKGKECCSLKNGAEGSFWFLEEKNLNLFSLAITLKLLCWKDMVPDMGRREFMNSGASCIYVSKSSEWVQWSGNWRKRVLLSSLGSLNGKGELTRGIGWWKNGEEIHTFPFASFATLFKTSAQLSHF